MLSPSEGAQIAVNEMLRAALKRSEYVCKNYKSSIYDEYKECIELLISDKNIYEIIYFSRKTGTFESFQSKISLSYL